jgi:hypothetical protein
MQPKQWVTYHPKSPGLHPSQTAHLCHNLLMTDDRQPNRLAINCQPVNVLGRCGALRGDGQGLGMAGQIHSNLVEERTPNYI